MKPKERMMETISRFAFAFLLNSLWQTTALVLVAAACSRLLGKVPASHRNLLWAMTLAYGLLLPLLSAAGFGAAGAFLPSRKAVEALTAAPASSPASAAAWLENILRGNDASAFFAPSLLSAATFVYLLFLLYRSIQLLRAWQMTSQIRRNASSQAIPDCVVSAAERCRAAFGLKKISILCSPKVESPVTLGSSRVVIALPQSLIETASPELSPELLTSALGHEMAHIHRQDFLLNLIYELIWLPISFHPAASYARRRIRETREMACDEMVTERLIDARQYARSLVRLASSLKTFNNPTCSLGIFDANNLEERIMRLTQRRPRASARLSKVLLAGAALTLALSAVAASAFALSVGQDKGGDSGSAKSIAGAWLLFPKEDGQSEEGPGIPVALYWTDGHLTGKAIHPRRRDDRAGAGENETIELAFNDLQFDGVNLSFKVYPGDKDDPSRAHYLEGKLKLVGDEFIGRWTSNDNHSGSLKMIRKKD
jgi:bla regulator protein blaR1